MFRFNKPKTPYSAKEIALFAAFDELHKTDDPYTTPTFILLMNRLPPLTLYKSAIESAFAGNWQGPHVEALRRIAKALATNKPPTRLTKEWDDLITFESLPSNGRLSAWEAAVARNS
jgi:hypothetical protein